MGRNNEGEKSNKSGCKKGDDSMLFVLCMYKLWLYKVINRNMCRFWYERYEII